MNKGTLVILSSGVALGAYIPPLIIHNQLKEKGVDTQFYVIENLIRKDKQDNILKNKFAFHRDFNVALVGQKLSQKSDYGIDQELVETLFSQWRKVKIVNFLIFSGFWLPIIEKYIERYNISDYKVDLCHLDSSISSSWKYKELNKSNFRHLWFYKLSDKKVNFCLKISESPPTKFKDRNNQFVIHGGGWGMGTYKEKINELKKHKIKLDIINYEINDVECEKTNGYRYFMIDPKWRTWDKYKSRYIFPPFGQLDNNNNINYSCNASHPGVYDLIKDNYGIISKPGGATLLDSFASGTPVIFLEPFGDYERDNATLWKNLGFGIDYEEWVSLGCATDILYQMHFNIIKMSSKVQNFINLYV